MRRTRDENPRHPHDLFTASSRLWPIVAGMHTDEAALAEVTRHADGWTPLWTAPTVAVPAR